MYVLQYNKRGWCGVAYAKAINPNTRRKIIKHIQEIHLKNKICKFNLLNTD